MPSDARVATISTLEEERFGVRTARAKVDSRSLPEALEFCREQGVLLLIARCEANHLDAAQSLEAAGASLMDTLVYYTRDFKRKPLVEESSPVLIRGIREGEAETVAGIAAETFRGYYGHFHADPRLDDAKCDEVYTSWTRRSCLSREVASEVLVCEVDGAIAGFATLRLNSPDEGEGVLFGVAPAAQGRGVYRAFMNQGLLWCREQGTSRMIVSTQITNLAVQKVWVRVGFEPSGAFYTFHKWFQPE